MNGEEPKKGTKDRINRIANFSLHSSPFTVLKLVIRLFPSLLTVHRLLLIHPTRNPNAFRFYRYHTATCQRSCVKADCRQNPFGLLGVFHFAYYSQYAAVWLLVTKNERPEILVACDEYTPGL